MDIGAPEWANPWLSVLQDLRLGNRIEKQTVVDLLRDPAPVPDEIKPLLADIISGEYKFSRGVKPDVLNHNVYRMILRGMVEHVEACLADPCALEGDDDLKVLAQEVTGLRGDPTPRELAKEYVADMYGISVRRLEKYL